MFNIEELDKNFKATPITQKDVVWHDVLKEPFSLHGIYGHECEDGSNIFLRMPKEIAKTVNPGVFGLCHMTTGGRVRFMTNSPYVAIKCVTFASNPHRNSNFFSTHGFGVYANNVYRGTIAQADVLSKDAVEGLYCFEGVCGLPTQCLEEICVHLPLYSGIKALYIGLKEGCSLQAAPAYKENKPVVFYGSSITQGGCASHSGNDYESLLSRWLNCDYLNLGFSGNGKGEQTMANYIASLDNMSVLVMDYDYNAPNADYLQETHLPFYETIHAAHPNLPVIFVSNANIEYLKDGEARREIIFNTYKFAKKRGDKVWFIDGKTIYGKDGIGGRDACTVDCIHPNDLGMYRIAKAIYPALKKALKKSK